MNDDDYDYDEDYDDDGDGDGSLTPRVPSYIIIYINTGAQVAAGYYNGNNSGGQTRGQFQFIDGGSR